MRAVHRCHVDDGGALRRRVQGARLLPLVAMIAVVALLAPPVVATADVLGGAPDNTAAPPPQTTPDKGRPKSLDGIQLGDPSEGVDLVDPPEPDSYGGAALRHPIELPQGRLNWQPQIALAYDSGGGDGWLGQGWDLSLDAIHVPGLGADVSADSISVDTRWGVPRYDAAAAAGAPLGHETETYVFGGEELSPTAHQSPQIPREAERRFTKRVEGDYLLIIRHGTSPQNFWWEVNDKIGNKYFYGGELDEYRTTDDSRPDAAHPVNAGHQVPEATLTDGDGNIYWWGLREKVDISTNSVTYFYDKSSVDLPGIGRGTQLYLSHINYSGSKLRADQTYAGKKPVPALPRYGRYDVDFVRQSTPPRTDVTSDATGGGLHVTADLLKRIDITYCPQARGSISPSHPSTTQLLACPETPQLVRRYDLTYTQGAFGKSLLSSVGKAGADGDVYSTQSFDYYNEVGDPDGPNGYNAFSSASPWKVSGGGVGGGPLGTLDGSALGASHSLGGDGRLYLGFALLPGKLTSVGGGFQLAGGNGRSDLEFMDINGDGLPDKVWLEGSSVKYQLNQSGPHGTESIAPDAKDATGISTLSQDSDFSVGVSAEAYVAVIALMYDHSWTFSKETTYFSDVNADGRPDLVDGGHVLFNVLQPNGQIRFTDDSSQTAVRLGPSVGLDPAKLLPSQDAVAAQQAGSFPKVDTLRRWVAPWTGTVTVTAPVNVVGKSLDGVGVRFERRHLGLLQRLAGLDEQAVAAVLHVGDHPLHPGAHRIVGTPLALFLLVLGPIAAVDVEQETPLVLVGPPPSPQIQTPQRGGVAVLHCRHLASGWMGHVGLPGRRHALAIGEADA